jgi:teichuronic acid biosynthesis glycosyltransferase TuaC
MKILVVSNNYPDDLNPNRGVFVYNLVQELCKIHEIVVISPQKIGLKKIKEIKNYGVERATVYRPRYFSFSNKNLWFFNSSVYSNYFLKKSIEKTFSKLKEEFDVIYCHFLINAISVFKVAKNNNIPLVVASGESEYSSLKFIPDKLFNEFTYYLSHCICVSENNYNHLTKLGLPKNKLSIIPNAVNYELFRPLERKECKRKLGIQNNIFVVGFIGHFIHRKGPDRIIQAVGKLKDPDILVICVGKGELESCTFLKVIDPLPNHQLPEIINAMDLFVLPTLSEGHCNVIEEVKACGIPIISSKGTTVENQINDKTGILVNPLDINEISTAILNLKNSKSMRLEMEKNLLLERGLNSINERVKKINAILELVTKK